MKWEDGNPLTYQEWLSNPSALASVSSIRLSGGSDNIGYWSHALREAFRTAQPSNTTGHNCTVIFLLNRYTPVWIKVPCEERLGFSKVICEYEKNISAVATLVRSRQPKQCPQSWLYVQGQCYLVVRYSQVSTTEENPPENVCDALGSKIADQEHINYLRRYFLFLLGWNPVVYLLMQAESPNEGSTSHCSLVPSDTENRHSPPSRAADVAGSNCDSLAWAAHGVVCKIQADIIQLGTCLRGLYRCQDGTCILNKYLCDGRAQCPDKSDEVDCTDVCAASSKPVLADDCFSLCQQPQCLCSWKYFQCQRGGCVPWWAVCDCVNDCLDGSDETQCISCHTALEDIVAARTAKDQERDILKPNDDKQMATLGSNSSCIGGQSGCLYPPDNCFQPKSLCIYEKISFGHTQHCSNGDHLLSCSKFECPSFYKCTSSYCIALHKVCNGEADCPSGEDEGNCGDETCPDLLKCDKEGICVHPKDIQDGEAHCTATADDEDIYIHQPCPRTCVCIGSGLRCEQLNLATMSPAYLGVKMLNLNRAKVDFSKTNFRAFRNLLGLDMSENKLFQMYDSLFINQQSLIMLNLESNYLKRVARGYFSGLNNLRHLNLKNNPIQTVDPFSYTAMGQAAYLDLSALQLRQIAPKAFHGMHHCVTLNISFNHIGKISYGSFSGLPVLKVLDLSRNPITSFAPEEFFMIRMLHRVYMPRKEFCCQDRPDRLFSGSCSPSGVAISCEYYIGIIYKVLGWCVVALCCVVNGFLLLLGARGKKTRLLTLNVWNNIAGMLMALSVSLILLTDLSGSISPLLEIRLTNPANLAANFLYISSFEMIMTSSAFATAFRSVAVIHPLKSNVMLTPRRTYITIGFYSFLVVALTFLILTRDGQSPPTALGAHCGILFSSTGETLPVSYGFLMCINAVLVLSLMCFSVLAVRVLVRKSSILESEGSKRTQGSVAKYRAAYIMLVSMVNNSLGVLLIFILNILTFFGQALTKDTETIVTIIILPLTILLSPAFEALHSLAGGVMCSGASGDIGK